MNRTQARAAAMKLVYEWDMGGDGGEETCRECWRSGRRG
jgi:hypothetical protein